MIHVLATIEVAPGRTCFAVLTVGVAPVAVCGLIVALPVVYNCTVGVPPVPVTLMLL